MPQLNETKSPWYERTVAVPSAIPSGPKRKPEDFRCLIGDAVMLKRIEPSKVTASGRLFIPDGAEREEWDMYQAEVVATGPGTWSNPLPGSQSVFHPVEVQPGDRVLLYFIALEAGVTRVGENDEMCIVSEGYIQAVIEE